ncbi:MAG: hypothetical protein LBJ47_05805 [Tannerella sp.]|jgi:hypothetical protein|nr:hypothetical protein [Tannerella sp.]
MHIANPIYDTVFKFMMEDNRVAKAFLSAVIQEKVVELDFAAQEYTVRKPAEKDGKPEKPEVNYTVCRIDFSARIATPEGGSKTVVIELQKAKLMSDIMRFRRYLGMHYQNKGNTYGDENSHKARQIYCIFILGHDIGIPGCPVIRVDSAVWDVTTGQLLDAAGNEFIDSMHHRSWIVQTRQLKYSRRTDLERLLSVFDPGQSHILSINEDDYPKDYRPIIRRLRKAVESEQIQIEMEYEDDYLEELQIREREIAQAKKVIGEQKNALEEKDKVIEDKDNALEEQKKVIEELKKQLAGRRK